MKGSMNMVNLKKQEIREFAPQHLLDEEETLTKSMYEPIAERKKQVSARTLPMLTTVKERGNHMDCIGGSCVH